jgi:hypothetical protein
VKRPRKRAARLREQERLRDEQRRKLEQAERDGIELESTIEEPLAVDLSGNTPDKQRAWDEHEEFADLPPGMTPEELARHFWLTDEQGNTLPVSPEVYARYKRAALRRPKRPRLDREIEAAALDRMDEVRDYELALDRAEDWQERRLLRGKRPAPYTEAGQSFEEAAERRLRRYDYARDREAWAAGEQRRLEELETERQLARVRAEKILEEEERGGIAPVGGYLVKREGGLEHENQGKPNAIQAASKASVRAARKLSAALGRDAQQE